MILKQRLIFQKIPSLDVKDSLLKRKFKILGCTRNRSGVAQSWESVG